MLGPAEAAAAAKPCRVQGLAVTWSKEAIYYIVLNPAEPVVVTFVGKMLASKTAHKVTFDLKAQLKALIAGRICSSSMHRVCLQSLSSHTTVTHEVSCLLLLLLGPLHTVLWCFGVLQQTVHVCRPALPMTLRSQ